MNTPESSNGTAPNKDKILDRILKLFKLGGVDANTTEHEMMAAITKAKSLMAQYDLSMADVESKAGVAHTQEIAIKVEKYTAYTRKISNFAPYDYNVASAVETLTSTRAIVRRGRKAWDRLSIMSFVGSQVDVQIAAEIFIIFLESVRRAARQTYGPGWTGSHTSYALGFSRRMSDRSREMVRDLTPQQASTVALVVRDKTTAINQWLADNTTQETKVRRVRVADGSAYSQGYVDGGAMDLGVKHRMR